MDTHYFITILLIFQVCIIQGNGSLTFEGGSSEVLLVAENGTLEELVLDCPYIVDEEDDTKGFVIRWYYNQWTPGQTDDNNIDTSHPLYQWIPGGTIDTPQLTQLDELIDATYEHSTDPAHRYRALRLVTPTTTATGRYTCDVSNYFDEQRYDVYLTIYSLPSALSLSAEEVTHNNVTVQCSADPAYPQPNLALTMLLDGESKPLEGTSEITESDGLFNTTVFAVVDEEDLTGEGDIQFECQLTLPSTNLSITEVLHFGAVTAVEEAEEYTDYEEEPTVVLDASTHRSARRPPSSAAPALLSAPGLQMALLGAVALVTLATGLADRP